VLDGVVAIRHGAELAGAAVGAAVEPAVDDHAGAEAGAQRQAHQMAEAAAGAEVQLADGEGVGVVVDVRRHSVAPLELLLERHGLPGGDVLHPVDEAALEVDEARHAATDAGDLGVEEVVDGAVELAVDHLGGAPAGDGGSGAALHDTGAHLADAHLSAAEVHPQDRRAVVRHRPLRWPGRARLRGLGLWHGGLPFAFLEIHDPIAESFY
jgi:hypothetical protein